MQENKSGFFSEHSVYMPTYLSENIIRIRVRQLCCEE